MFSNQVYMAPERLTSNYTSAVDIYSLGIIFFELFHPVKSNTELKRLISDIQINAEFPKCLEQPLPGISRLIRSMIQIEPKMRPDIGHVESTIKTEQTKRGIDFEELFSVRIRPRNQTKPICSDVYMTFDHTVLQLKYRTMEIFKIHPNRAWFKDELMVDTARLREYQGIEYGIVEYDI